MLHHYGNASERKSYKAGTLCPIEIYLRAANTVFFVHLFLKKLQTEQNSLQNFCIYVETKIHKSRNWKTYIFYIYHTFFVQIELDPDQINSIANKRTTK